MAVTAFERSSDGGKGLLPGMRRLTVFAMFGLMACSSTAGQGTTMRETVLHENQAMSTLKQCSRKVPDNVDGTWTVSPDVVAQMESDFPKLAALGMQTNGNTMSATREWDPKSFFRQYVGITIHGKRYVYINAFADRASVLHDHDPDTWLKHPVMACDGGPNYWGALYDPETRQFSQLFFNGQA